MLRVLRRYTRAGQRLKVSTEAVFSVAAGCWRNLRL